ncbi:MAG: YceI family protein [Parvularcula sp.]|jgi:polyisoprenoid-binding protein YceI|nr:YceI family protein [Parvularcula sp.]
MKRYGAVALACLLVACGSEETSAPTEPTAAMGDVQTQSALPELVGASLWEVDRQASRLGFKATQNGRDFEGSFGAWEARILLDPEDPSAEGQIEAAVDVSSADAGTKERNDALPAGDWFDAARHPTARFQSSDIRPLPEGEGAYEAIGTLSLKGVTRDVTMPFVLTIGDDGRAVADGSVMLDRSDFNVGAGQFATGEWVGLEVEVTLHIEAEPAR